MLLGSPSDQAIPSNGVAAVDQATGAIDWFNSWPANRYFSYVLDPVIADGRIYVSERTQSVRALDAATGTILWTSQTAPGVFNNRPAVAAGRVFVTTNGDGGTIDPGLYAFDAVSGEPLWSQLSDVCNIPLWATVVGDSVLYVTCNSLFGARPDIVARRASDGQLLWSTTLSSSVVTPLVAHGDLVFVAIEKAVLAMSVTTGETQWRLRSEDIGKPVANMAWANGVLFVLTEKAPLLSFELRAFDATTGSTLYVRSIERRLSRPLTLTVADGRVQIGYYVEGADAHAFRAAFGL